MTRVILLPGVTLKLCPLDAPKIAPEVTVSMSGHVHTTLAPNVDKETLKTVGDREGNVNAVAPPPWLTVL